MKNTNPSKMDIPNPKETQKEKNFHSERYASIQVIIYGIPTIQIS